MCPAVVAGESGKKAGGSNSTALAPADVGHIGEIALQRLSVFLPQRQTPGAVVTELTGAEQRIGELVVVAEQARGMGAQRDHAGAP